MGSTHPRRQMFTMNSTKLAAEMSTRRFSTGSWALMSV